MTDSTPSYADRLRAAADLIGAHPHLPRPCVFAYSSGTVDVSWHVLSDDDNSPEAQRAAARAVIAAIGGKWTKKPWADRFDFHQTRDGLNLEIFAHRDAVCERVVTGTKEVTREVPDPDVQVPTVTVTETVEQVEWRCEPVLAGRVTA